MSLLSRTTVRTCAMAAALYVVSTGNSQVAADQNAPDDSELATAIFAGGCFWCMEPPYDMLPGVKSTVSGYIGGDKRNPSYKEVSAGGTGHAEAVEVRFDPKVVDYETLLHVFWRNIDPLAVDRQFCDQGSQYRSAIFYLDDEQRQLAEASKKKLEESDRFSKPIVTEIVAAETFYAAEEGHQDYYMKNALRYKYYRFSCGRDNRLEMLWGEQAGGHSS